MVSRVCVYIYIILIFWFAKVSPHLTSERLISQNMGSRISGDRASHEFQDRT